MKNFNIIYLLLVLLNILIGLVYSAPILSLDLGADSIKVGLLNTGQPLDVVLDKDSSRKLLSSITFKTNNGNERLFGKQSHQQSTRFPNSSFNNLKLLISKSIDSDAFDRWSDIWSFNSPISSNRNSIEFNLRNFDNPFSVEELLAMQFTYAKDLAQATLGEPVKDTVLTLPPYFSTFERQSILDALNLASLKPLALINDGSAVAINYAMTRNFDNPTKHIIYDAGASSISATVVEFSSIPSSAPKSKFSSSKSKNETVINVMGVGYDDTVGGMDFDNRLRSLLADAFDAQYKGKLDPEWRLNGRAWNKLLLEANRVKHILSANSDAQATIEGLYDEFDFKAKVSRSDLNSITSDFKSNYTAAIDTALNVAGIKLDDISSIILTGGASRIPIVQSSVREYVNNDDKKISTSVNADEAAALGSAFYGASLSKSFKTKPLKLNEAVVFDMIASVNEDEETYNLWSRGQQLPVEKSLKLKPKDTKVAIEYDQHSIPHDHKAPYMLLTISGVEDSLNDINMNYEEAVKNGLYVDLKIEQTAFSLVFSPTAELVIPPPTQTEGLTGKLREWFSSHKESNGDENNNNSTDVNNDEKKEDKRIKLQLSSLPLSFEPMTVDAKGESMEKLFAMNKEELMKSLREESFNGLESRLYTLKSVLENEGDAFGLFHNNTKPEEMSTLTQVHSESLQWLSENGEQSTLEQIQEVAKRINDIEKPIKDRLAYNKLKSNSLSDLQRALFAGRTFLQQARKNLTTTDESRYSFKEIDEFEAHLFKTENWLRPLMRKDEESKPWEEGAFTPQDLESAGKSVQSYFMELVNRKPAQSTTSSSSSFTSSSTTSTPSESLSTTSTSTSTSTSTPTSTADENANETQKRYHHEHDEL